MSGTGLFHLWGLRGKKGNSKTNILEGIGNGEDLTPNLARVKKSHS